MEIKLTEEGNSTEALTVATTEKKGYVSVKVGGKTVTVKANDLQKAIRAAS